MQEPDVLVVGSINYDLFLFQDRLAALGETILATDVNEAFGGKGANQAVQAAKLGAGVAFLGAVGADDRGEACVRNLESFGIECHTDTVQLPTGLGVVNVLPDGEVHSTIVEGANGRVDGDFVAGNAALFDGVRYVVLQNEIPESGLREAVALARKAGATVVYNAAPARDWAREISCDFLIVNEEEAQVVAGRRAHTMADWLELSEELSQDGPGVVITLGPQGSVHALAGSAVHVPAEKVVAVDTTGAGDSYVGAFVAALLEGRPAAAAATLAGMIASATTAGVGAQTSMPDRWV